MSIVELHKHHNPSSKRKFWHFTTENCASSICCVPRIQIKEKKSLFRTSRREVEVSLESAIDAFRKEYRWGKDVDIIIKF